MLDPRFYVATLGIVLAFGTAQARSISERSQDRIVVTERGKSYSVPAPQGSGKTFISKGRTFNEIVKDGRRDRITPDDHKSKNRKHRK